MRQLRKREQGRAAVMIRYMHARRLPVVVPNPAPAHGELQKRPLPSLAAEVSHARWRVTEGHVRMPMWDVRRHEGGRAAPWSGCVVQ